MHDGSRSESRPGTQAVGNHAGAVEALLALGWAQDEDEEALVVPKGRYFSMAEVSHRIRGVTTRNVSWSQSLSMAVQCQIWDTWGRAPTLLRCSSVQRQPVVPGLLAFVGAPD